MKFHETNILKKNYWYENDEFYPLFPKLQLVYGFEFDDGDDDSPLRLFQVFG